MDEYPTVIIGAGLTGLSCAYHLGGDYLLIEREPEPGGIVRTRVRETPYGPFLCDGTGHWLHLRTPDMRTLVAKLVGAGLCEYERRAVIHLEGTFTPYPFQANTYGLPRQVVLDCVLGLLKARFPEEFGLHTPVGAPAHFLDSVTRLFGEGICRSFMVPYNEKVLGVKLEEISADYADRFIPRPSLEDVVKGALGFSREALGYNARFVYPREGGIGALSTGFAAALPSRPRYNSSVTAINLRDKMVSTAESAPVRYKHLLNTMPLLSFLHLVGDELPAEIQTAASGLRATTVYYFDLGVQGTGASASDYHWIYFPEPEFIFYRVGSYSAVHRAAAPPGCRSYYIEMSGGITELLEHLDELRSRVLADLTRAEVLAEDDKVLFMEFCVIPYAYVIFDELYETSRRTVLDWLATKDVLTCGRWGGWNYGGMEDAMLEGKAAAQYLRMKL
jgi:protoporphyrinogen oxidase